MRSRLRWLTAAAVRGRRFAYFATRDVFHDVRFMLRSAVRLGALRQLRGTVRRAWLRSDPEWAERLRARLAEGRDEAGEAAERRRAEARERLAAEGPLIYTGELRVRPAFRGVVLADHPGRPDIEAWLCDELRLDDYAGDTAHVRLTVEFLTDRGEKPNAP